MQDEMTSEKQETEEASPPPAKKSKVDDHRDTETIQHNADGDPYIDLSSKKRLTVRTWKGSVLIDIREFYEKNGQLLPGNKGISLTMDQFQTLQEAIRSGNVDTMIQQKGR